MVRVYMPRWKAGIWKPVSIVDMSQPVSDEIRTVGRRFIETGRAAGLTHISENYAGKNVQTEKMYYPKIEYFLTHGQAQRVTTASGP